MEVEAVMLNKAEIGQLDIVNVSERSKSIGSFSKFIPKSLWKQQGAQTMGSDVIKPLDKEKACLHTSLHVEEANGALAPTHVTRESIEQESAANEKTINGKESKLSMKLKRVFGKGKEKDEANSMEESVRTPPSSSQAETPLDSEDSFHRIRTNSDADAKRNLYSDGSQLQNTPMTSPSKSASSYAGANPKFPNNALSSNKQISKLENLELNDNVNATSLNNTVNVSTVSLNFIDENEEVQNFDGNFTNGDKKRSVSSVPFKSGSESPFMVSQLMKPFPISSEFDVGTLPLPDSVTAPKPELRRTASQPVEANLMSVSYTHLDVYKRQT